MTGSGTRRSAVVPSRVAGRIASHLRGNSIGYLVLFVALGGSSYAAGSVKPGSLHTGAIATAVTHSKLTANRIDATYMGKQRKPTRSQAGKAGGNQVTVTPMLAGGWPTTPSAISRFSHGFVTMERGYAALTAGPKHLPLSRTARLPNPAVQGHPDTGSRRCQLAHGKRAARHSDRSHRDGLRACLGQSRPR
jgi:hypothetical protein